MKLVPSDAVRDAVVAVDSTDIEGGVTTAMTKGAFPSFFFDLGMVFIMNKSVNGAGKIEGFGSRDVVRSVQAVVRVSFGEAALNTDQSVITVFLSNESLPEEFCGGTTVTITLTVSFLSFFTKHERI